MTIPMILESIRTDLARDILAGRDNTRTFHPANYDPYIAASILQKAIRRGDEAHALRAAARLLESAPARLWRRLLVIGFEDIGIGDLDVVGKVTAVHGQKRWRTAHGGEWPIIAMLVSNLCRAPKDRTADDILHLAENDPRLEDHRRCWSTAPIDRLAAIISDPETDFVEQVLALWFGVGTDRYRSPQLRARRGFPEDVYATFKTIGISDEVLAISWVGHKKMSWPLAAFLPLIWHRARGATREIESDTMPPCSMIGDAPSYALDTFTRGGKTAIRELVKSSTPLRHYLTPHAPQARWPAIVALMLFRVEGGLMANRLRWKEGDAIKEVDDLTIPGLPREAVPEALEILKQELSTLNAIRTRIGVPNFR